MLLIPFFADCRKSRGLLAAVCTALVLAAGVFAVVVLRSDGSFVAELQKLIAQLSALVSE